MIAEWSFFRLHQSRLYIYIYLNEDTQLVMRAIGVSHTACKDEFRRNLRSHSWGVFSLFIIYGIVIFQRPYCRERFVACISTVRRKSTKEESAELFS